MSQGEILLVERILNAPVAKVWDAWENPENLAQWWRVGMVRQTVITEYDFRLGGT